ncbi:hypothetical protein HML84_07075 [Alcanivorax sp. IO_7]|nr:hypothetical protein HML84_07075 [Alcanivorax sp. IO_7]
MERPQAHHDHSDGHRPGSRHTGYGIIEQVGNRSTVVDFGTISTRGSEMAPRLGKSSPGCAR